MARPSNKVNAYLSIRQDRDMYMRGHRDVEMLLQGTPEEIGAHIAESVRNALGNGGISEIRIIPIPPYNVWDLAKQ